MNQGRPIQAVASEIMAQARSKNDYVVQTNKLVMTPDGTITIPRLGDYGVNNHAHNQLAEHLNIPSGYYRRMQAEAPELLAKSVNTWFEKAPETRNGPEKRMLRTITQERPTLRAFLSDRYRRLDNIDLLQAVVPFMMTEYGKPLSIVSSEVTETRLYIKVVAPHTERDLTTLLKPGTHTFISEIVRAGFVVQNSEIGMGAISVMPYVDVLRCTNGMIVSDFGQRKYHTGKRQGGGNGGDDGVESILSDETRMLEDAAFWNRTKDIIKACLDENKVLGLYKRLAEARDMKIEGNPEEVVELLAQNYGLNEDEKGGVLRSLIDTGLGLNKYALSQAVTEVAGGNDKSGKANTIVKEYDRASALEKLGGDLATMSAQDWAKLQPKN